jgi:xylonate dehydratase
VVDADGVYRKTGPARVFTSERAAIAAIKGRARADQAGDVIVLICRGRWGRHGRDLPDHLGAQAPALRQAGGVITDARFSGVSTGACIGHVGPEALAGGPIGKVRDGD